MSYLRVAARLWATATLTLAAVLSSSAHAALPVQPNDDILGRWKITKVLDASNVTALDDKEATHLVGKIFIVEPNKSVWLAKYATNLSLSVITKTRFGTCEKKRTPPLGN